MQMVARQDWRYVSAAAQVARGAHAADSEITSVALHSSGRTLVSRGADDTLKVSVFVPCLTCLRRVCVCARVHVRVDGAMCLPSIP